MSAAQPQKLALRELARLLASGGGDGLGERDAKRRRLEASEASTSAGAASPVPRLTTPAAATEPTEGTAASPFLRCVQTAAEIAKVLKCPVLFDRELGEVYDEASAAGRLGHNMS